MTLRLRILLGYGFLVGLLLLASGSAFFGFLQLSTGIDRVLEKNYASIRAATELGESLERQDSATLAALLETDAPPAADWRQLEASFYQALAQCEGNVTEEGEAEIVVGIRTGYEHYRSARRALLAAVPEEGVRPLARYERTVAAPFQEVKEQVAQLLAVNQQAMVREDREARHHALVQGTWLGFLITIALIAIVFFSRALQRDLLTPLARLCHDLDHLTESSDRLSGGGEDELGSIVRRVNTLQERHQKAEGRARGRLASERRRLHALVAAWGPGAGLYAPDGRRLSGREDTTPTPAALGAWIRKEGAALAAEAEDSEPPRREVNLEGGAVELCGLIFRGRVVGWLTLPQRAPRDAG